MADQPDIGSGPPYRGGRGGFRGGAGGNPYRGGSFGGGGPYRGRGGYSRGRGAASGGAGGPGARHDEEPVADAPAIDRGGSRGFGRGSARGGAGGGAGGGGGRAGAAAAEEIDIGGTAYENVQWLKRKSANWDASQLIHEFSNRHARAWEQLVSTPEATVTAAWLQLLARPELRDNEAATPLFAPLQAPAVNAALSQYVSIGNLSDDSAAEAAGEGAGSAAWNGCVTEALALLAVLSTLMARFVDSQTQFKTIITVLQSNMQAVLEAVEEQRWAPGVGAAQRDVHTAQATLLRTELSQIKKLQTTAVALLRQRAAEQAAAQASAEEARKLRTARARSGVAVLDDPARDADFLSISVVPAPEELASTQTDVALPINLVAPGRTGLSRRALGGAGGRDGDGEEEAEADDAAAATALARAVPPAAVPRYRSAHHLLNTHFQLLRYDCLGQLRTGIRDFRKRLEDAGGVAANPGAMAKAAAITAKARGESRIGVYEDVRVVNVEPLRSGGLGYVVRFSIPGRAHVDWGRTNRLMTGSLLALSHDGTFADESLVLAMVAQSVDKERKASSTKPLTITLMIDTASVRLFDHRRAYIMLESPVFFEAYRHVLTALQALGTSSLPFEGVLLGRSHELEVPSYVLRAAAAAAAALPELGAAKRAREEREKLVASKLPITALIGSKPAAPELVADRGWHLGDVFPDYKDVHGTAYWQPSSGSLRSLPSDPPLDASQHKALELVLSKQVALIQGPPGTGKTFVGVLATRLLLANRHLRAPKPILFICQTNHALDQILEHVYKFEQNIIRLGGRSQSAIMLQCSLDQAKKRASLRVSRQQEEWDALARAKRALAGLKAAMLQRNSKVVALGGGGGAGAGGGAQQVAAVPVDASLARLRTLLAAVAAQDGVATTGAAVQNPVESMLAAIPDKVQYSLWMTLAKLAAAHAASWRPASPVPFHLQAEGTKADRMGNVVLTAYDAWKQLPIAERSNWLSFLMGDQANSALAELWVQDKQQRGSKGRKGRGAKEDAEGWQTVGGDATTDSGSFRDFSGLAATGAAESAAAAADGDVEEADVEAEDRDIAGDAYNLQDLFDTMSLFRQGDRFSEEFSAASAVFSRRCTPERLAKLLQDCAFTTAEKLALRHACTIDIWAMQPTDRAYISGLWCRLLEADAAADVEEFQQHYLKAAEVEQRYHSRLDAEVLSGAAVIGMTTTGAAKHNTMLRQLGPEVLLVEEAAEVLEGHILAALTPSVKHLILIGDHLQLRPQVAQYELVRNHALDISLFERLVNAGVPCVTLSTQRRMHPEVSELVRRTIYPAVRDHDSVHLHPAVRGVKNRVFFFSHTVPEDGEVYAFGGPEPGTGGAAAGRAAHQRTGGDEGGKSNTHEAQLIVRLVRHLLLNGYTSDRIVVLSMYKGQLMLLRKLAKEMGATSQALQLQPVSSVRMTTTDNFQGEEADIVIISLVRSNLLDGRGKLGFVSIANRINVALSRARDGMFVFGNFPLMRERSQLWDKICGIVEARCQLGGELVLQCPKHAAAPAVAVSTPADFDKSPHGGCMLPCGETRECGHACKLVCHVVSHEHIMCMEPCTQVCQPCGHPCMRRCYQNCNPCPRPVERTRQSCKHTFTLPCGEDIELVKCPKKCDAALICGHRCAEDCHSHPPSYQCKQACTKKRPTCSHPCTKLCWEQCGPCMERAMHTLPCGHEVEATCSADISTLKCTAPCPVTFSCGHACPALCGQPCPTTCAVEVLKLLPLCGAADKHLKSMPCSQDPLRVECTEPCRSLLPCGHVCTGSCSGCWQRGIPDHQMCMAPCEQRCVHAACDRACGDLCKPCEMPCTWHCAHALCCARCSEPHSACAAAAHTASGFRLQPCGKPCPPATQPLCNEPCSRKLTCGHGCMGVCGELCPPLCAVCDLQQVQAHVTASALLLPETQRATLLAADVTTLRFVQLVCGHVFEVSGCDHHAHAAGSACVPLCPACTVPLRGPFRYDALLHQHYQLRLPGLLAALERHERTLVQQQLAAGKLLECTRRLRAALADRRDALRPLRHMLLGRVLMARGDVLDARRAFSDASKTAAPALRAESLRYLAESHLLAAGAAAAHTDPEAVRMVSDTDLKAAQTSLTAAIEAETSAEQAARSAAVLRAVTAVQQERARAAAKAKEDRERALQMARQRAEQIARANQAAAAAAAADVVQPSSEDVADVQRHKQLQQLEKQVMDNGGSELHLAAVLGKADRIRAALRTCDPWARDRAGDTPLHIACRARNAEAVELLLPLSQWAAVNKAGSTAIELALLQPVPMPAAPVLAQTFTPQWRASAASAGGGGAAFGSSAASTTAASAVSVTYTRWKDETAAIVQAEVVGAQGSSDAARKWARARCEAVERTDATPSEAMDQLMGMSGLAAVKAEALSFYHQIQLDLLRPPEARVATKQAMNFVFTGNPGTGKTTVARIFARLLKELGLRTGSDIVEKTGQKLLDEGSGKFADTLKAATPGVLFIDEVYQLDPGTNADGRSITNSILSAAEDLRDKLTFIVAGYKDDVQEKWLASNEGLPSRFTYHIHFEDFTEAELRSIFLGMVTAASWRLETPPADSTDIATIAARRIGRGRGGRGFANARSMRVLFELAQRRTTARVTQRMNSGERLSLSLDTPITLLKRDVLGEPVQPDKLEAYKELMALPGLAQVKESVNSLLQLALDNFRREEEGKPYLDISLHKLFLGNPGTGKTTVAGIYGRILRELNYLSSGDVDVVGASKLCGDVVGSTAKAVNSRIDTSKGKVLVIDEAYNLAKSMYGKEALDTLVERVQGTPGEDFAVLLAGYDEPMREMLRTCNPGLARRFKLEDAFHFEDYNDDQLVDIMLQQAGKRGLKLAAEVARAAVVNVLAKQRAKPNFGNAGAVRNLLDSAVQRMSRRQEAARRSGMPVEDMVLVAEDLFTLPPPGAALAALQTLVNAAPIRDRIDRLQKQIKTKQARGETNRAALLQNWCFVGPPGTGKTTVARAFGDVFHGLGLLADNKVVECKAQELIAGYVGQSGGLVRDKMDEARGGVLFIDEAYGLDITAGAPVYAKDALESLLGNLTDPRYAGNMVVILAGYPAQIDSLLASNPGMPRRFPEKLEFKDWEPQHCVELVHLLLAKEKIDCSPALDDVLLDGFSQLAVRPNFGNAGDAVSIARGIQARWEERFPDDGRDPGPIITPDITAAFDAISATRPTAEGLQSVRRRPVAPAATATASAAAAAPPPPPVTASTATTEKEAEAEAEPEQKKQQQAEPPISPDTLFACLEQALRELGYDLQRCVDVVSSRTFPDELLELVADKAASTPARVKPMLLAQCPALLPRLEVALKQQQEEAERQRLAELEMERAREEEKARLREEEEQRRREAMGAWICGVCGRMGCPVMPRWHSWSSDTGPPVPLVAYNGNNGPAYGGAAPRRM